MVEPSTRDARQRQGRTDLGAIQRDPRDAWIGVMRQCIALNASFFNTHRMVRQYLLHAYALREEP